MAANQLPNGNMTTMPQGAGTATLAYDVENRLISSSAGEQYAYAPDNKRIWRRKADANEDIYFYAPDRSRLGTYRRYSSGTTLKFLEVGKNVYIGGRMIRAEGTAFVPDRLGSGVNEGRRYFPYGQEGTATGNDRTKFATYHRDSTTGLDYADQRYSTSQYGRFMTADPVMGRIEAPQSWNRYAYVAGDPVNQYDPTGELVMSPGGDSGAIWIPGVGFFFQIFGFGGPRYSLPNTTLAAWRYDLGGQVEAWGRKIAQNESEAQQSDRGM